MENSQRHQKASSQAGGRVGNRRVDLLNSCFRILSLRPRSESEVVSFLKKKTTDADLISEIITQLKQLKYIDDAKFSSWLVESRSRSRPRGKRLLVREMKAKGISADDIKVEIDETSLAGKALEKKLHVWKSLPYKEFKTKSYRFLAARGFPWEVIERVTRKLYNGQDVTDED